MEKLSPSSVKDSQKSIYNHITRIYINDYRNSMIYFSISSRILDKNSPITGLLNRGSLVIIFRKQSGLFVIKRFNSFILLK